MRSGDLTTFVGRGVDFPLRPDPRGALALVSEVADIERSIRLIMATSPGERPMRPAFGCRIHDLVFASTTPTTIGSIRFEVERSVRRWEPRVDTEQVLVHDDDDVDGLLYIHLVYRIKRTNDERNLVFPFYVIPDHED